MATNKNDAVVLKGVVQQFWTGGKEKPRRWITVEIPFRDACRVIKIETFDSETGKGIQRAGIESWQKSLSKKMETGVFTPNPWSAGVSKSHIKGLTIEVGKVLELEVSPRNPLTSLDGQQRWGGMEILRKKFESDPDRRKALENSTITFPVYLDPEYTHADFQNLQYGRPVDKSHMLSMELAHNSIPDEKKPFLKLAEKTARLINEATNSPFAGRIKFDSRDEAPLALKSLLTLGASDISTSIGGGAKIAHHFKKDAAWLANMYVGAFVAIEKFGTKDEVESELDDTVAKVPTLLRKGKLLYPRGKKGSSSLLIGIGNLVAYRMARQNKDDIKPADAKKLVECLEDIFDKEINGNLSGPDKRRMMGQFCSRYFADIVRMSEEDEGDTKKVESLSYHGTAWPYELVELLSKSSFLIPKDAVVNGYEKAVSDDEDEDDDFEEAEEETEETEADEEEGEAETEETADEEEETEPEVGEEEEDEEDDFAPAPTPTPPPLAGRRGRGRGRSTEVMG